MQMKDERNHSSLREVSTVHHNDSTAMWAVQSEEEETNHCFGDQDCS